MNFGTSPENEADIQALTEALRALSIGSTLSYASMSATIGRDITARRWLLQRACKEAETETGSLYEAVRGEGIRRLAGEETPSVGLAAIRRVRRAAKRGVQRLSKVRSNDLEPDVAAKIVAHKSQLGAISLVADGRKSATIVSEAERTGAEVPAGRVLELFKR